jgi:hypothetical protein
MGIELHKEKEHDSDTKSAPRYVAVDMRDMSRCEENVPPLCSFKWGDGLTLVMKCSG